MQAVIEIKKHLFQQRIAICERQIQVATQTAENKERLGLQK